MLGYDLASRFKYGLGCSLGYGYMLGYDLASRFKYGLGCSLGMGIC